MAGLHDPGERAVLPDEMGLTDELLERARPHPGGEWRIGRNRGVEEGLGRIGSLAAGHARL